MTDDDDDRTVGGDGETRDNPFLWFRWLSSRADCVEIANERASTRMDQQRRGRLQSNDDHRSEGEDALKACDY